MPDCPDCKSKRIIKNGHIHNGKQNFKYHDCGRQLVENPTQKIISQETKDLIDKLLLEKFPLIPSKRHRQVEKQPRNTNFIERFNCTIRQRFSGLIRKALFFENIN